MSILKNKKTLTVIMILVSLVLISTTLVAWQRYQAKKNYEVLADIRAKQDDASNARKTNIVAEMQVSGIGVIDGATESKSTNKVATTQIDPYMYIPNENTDWLSINPDYFGWIKIAGTNIDYPFVRSHDNEDYLTLDFNGNFSDAGTLFMDYRNLGNFNDKHTIIYGHYMKNKTLFHNLTLYHEKDYYDKNQVIEIAGIYETKTYKIFSVYEISADDYAFSLDFDEERDYRNYLETLSNLSRHGTDFEIDGAKRLLSLVTCSYGVGNGRTIIHAIEQ